MWPFKHKPSNLEVLERLESLERRFKTLNEDCSDFFDSVRRAENRIKHKQKVLDSERADATPEEQPADEQLPASTGGLPGLTLSPRQKLIQQQVLRRRAGIQ